MPAACRTNLEALLRARKLDRTLVSADRAAQGRNVPGTAPTGLPALDQALGGGLPLGHLSEVVGPRSSGRTSLMVAMMATMTGRGELVALVDSFDVFAVETAVAAGVDLTRCLWVRGETCTPAFPLLASRQTGTERAIERALKATNLILQAGGFGLVVLDLADAPARALRRVPFTTWARLQRVLEGRECAGLVIGNAPMSRSAGGVSLVLEPDAGRAGVWNGQGGPTPMFGGLESRLQIQRAHLMPGVADRSVRLTAAAQVA
ncbi:MAG: hypothetical protein AB1806_20085 [Acidobacteriota bacterium]